MRLATAAFGSVVVLGLLAWLAVEVLLGAPVVRVENRSGEPLSSLQIRGSNFERRLDVLSSGKSKCFRLSERFGESALALVAKHGAGEIRAGDLIYLEGSGGYRVVVTVTPGPSVDASYGPMWVALCWLWT
jgi:hypothetical protein